MNLQEFTSVFPSYAACKDHFVQFRINNGLKCNKCNHRKHYWLAKKDQYQCKCCGHRTSFRSGTLLEKSKLPVWYWYVAIYITNRKNKNISTLEIKSILGHKRYQPIWLMMKKINSLIPLIGNSLDGTTTGDPTPPCIALLLIESFLLKAEAQLTFSTQSPHLTRAMMQLPVNSAAMSL